MTQTPQYDPRETTFLTADIPGTGGVVKASPESFVVEEIPAYEPNGEGEHVYLWVEKRDVSANQLVRAIAKRCGVHKRAVGTAGNKDRRAVTRQWISVHHHDLEPDTVLGEVSEGIEILRATRHRNKLKTGHLRGNRFIVELEAFEAPVDEAAELAGRTLDVLEDVGAPNYFGSQRFGNDLETLRLGLARIRGDRPGPLRNDRWLERLSVSAVQSAMFNYVLDRRIIEGTPQTAIVGDRLNRVGVRGQLFVTEEVLDEAQRGIDAGELVPTGPMFGPKMYDVAGAVAEVENDALALFDLTLEDFANVAKLAPGTRRDLFVRFIDPPTVEEAGEDRLRIAFSLPSGAYATVVLSEIAKFDFSAWEAT